MNHSETMTEAINRKQSEMEEDIIDAIIAATERSVLGGKLKAEAIMAAAERAVDRIVNR